MDENRETVRRLTLAMSRMDGAYYYFARKSGLKRWPLPDYIPIHGRTAPSIIP